MKRPFSSRTRTAHHEAGHAVLSAAINDTPRVVSIRPEGITSGRVLTRRAASAESMAQVYLAGFAAEHLLTGRRPPDLDREIGMAILAICDPELVASFAGIDACDGHRAIQEILATGIRITEVAMRDEVERIYEKARTSLVTLWEIVRTVAAALEEHETIDGDVVMQLVMHPGSGTARPPPDTRRVLLRKKAP